MSSSFSGKTSFPTKVQTPEPLILKGSDRLGQTEQVVSVYYPWDNVTLVGEYHLAQMAQIEQIEQAAEQGFQAFRKTTPAQRAAILFRLAALIEKKQEDLATLITQESGKPIKLSRMEVARSVDLCRAYATEAERAFGQILQVEGREARIRQFPIGPVLAITPYNFPLNLVVHKLAPAIAAGCSITIKPAPHTPLTALKLGQLAIQAGYEAISVVPAPNEVAEELVKSKTFAKLSFTGSAKVGWFLRKFAGHKSVTLELGGNAALIIEDIDGPVEAMAERVAFGAFAFAGQICISVQRILINERIKDEFMEAFIKATRNFKVGDPMRGDTELGPMISIEEVQRARRMIKDALQSGANVVYGGNTFNALTMNPTILDRTTPEMAVNAEEVFAPIVTVTFYQDFEEALAMANESKYGLQAGVYTHDARQMELAYQLLDVGGVVINDIPTYRCDRLPYGGVKASGLGREGVLAGIAEYSSVKTLVVKSALG
jgi:acyl-CoA reductase-like NAD-dependent aldehyde dehydrogenase